MTIVFEPRYVVKAVVARLTADTNLNTTLGLGGRVYRDLAPQGSAYPVALVSPYTAVDLNTVDGTHIWQNVQVLVKFVDQFKGRAMSAVAIEQMAERAAVLLQGYSVVVDGVWMTQFRRSATPPQGPDTVRGVRYGYANSIFDVEAQAA